MSGFITTLAGFLSIQCAIIIYRLLSGWYVKGDSEADAFGTMCVYILFIVWGVYLLCNGGGI